VELVAEEILDEVAEVDEGFAVVDVGLVDV